ncbi:metallophosphoesterase [Undibacterium sp. Di24W]|uniref:metallophosphoesterase n=1 Tax=Undibacterium sp. Di24W TaxID=3413033 RepID=UPI003BF5756A
MPGSNKIPSPRGKHNHFWRHWGELILDTFLCRGLIAKCCYRLGLHGKLSVTQYIISLTPVRALPRPLTIAFLSDFHAGPTTHPQIFSDAFDAIAKHDVSLLLLGGDFISCKAHYIEKLIPMIANVHAPLGKFAVLGNHDLWVDDDYLCQQLNNAGVRVLTNQNARLPEPFSMISVCGTDDPWTGEVDIAQAFKDSASIRLLLTHAPDGLLFLNGEKFEVAFAGHTHGGQIANSYGQPFMLPHGHLSKQYHHGLFDIPDNGQLIVSRGIGCTNLPLRVNAAPELVLCTLI